MERPSRLAWLTLGALVIQTGIGIAFVRSERELNRETEKVLSALVGLTAELTKNQGDALNARCEFKKPRRKRRRNARYVKR